MNSQEIENLLDSRRILEDHINSYLRKLSQLKFIDAPDECEDCKMSFGDTRIYFEWTTEEGCMGCYDTEYHEYYMPVEYLSQDVAAVIKELKDEEKRERDEEARIRRERNELAAAERAIEKEEKDYEKYLLLKERYEGETT